jgi:hypothetical protein
MRGLMLAMALLIAGTGVVMANTLQRGAENPVDGMTPQQVIARVQTH